MSSTGVRILIADDHPLVRGALAQAVAGAAAGAEILEAGDLEGVTRIFAAGTDIDLILLYDFDEGTVQSDGARPLAPSHYYSRLTQRLITALSAPTAEGTLYEVDMRLRPSGQKGPMATRLSSFIAYQEAEAWTWEHMAMTRARVIAGPQQLRERVETAIDAVLEKRRDRAKIAADVRDMRARIEAEKGTTKLWDLKQVRGGLVDLEFIAQHLQLVFAADHPDVLDQNTLTALGKLAAAGVLADEDAAKLVRAGGLIHALTQIVRLSLDSPFDPATAPGGLKQLLAKAADLPDFATVEAHLRAELDTVHAAFGRLVV